MQTYYLSRMKLVILAIDNDPLALATLETLFKDDGFEIKTATSGEQGIILFKEDPRKYPFVLLDYEMKRDGVGINGDEVARQLKTVCPEVRIVMVSGSGNPQVSRACLDAGAEDFLIKGNPKQLLDTIKTMFFKDEYKVHQDEEANRQVIARVLNMTGRSQELAKIAELTSRFAQFPGNVLLTGPTGSGKEQIARAIHDNSPRKNKPFIVINCSAIPANLLESELFGHMKGSFTGADQNKIGAFEQASGGTIFLDEIDKMPVELQAKILRVLQEKVIRPVGGVDKSIDFRVIAASNRNLVKAAEQDQFLSDLYFRLKCMRIEVPALSERPEDIEPLIHHFLRKMEAKSNLVKSITAGAVRALKSHNWPGNVRELENAVNEAFALANGTITEKNVKDVIGKDSFGESITQLRQIRDSRKIIPMKDIDQLYMEAQRHLLTAALAATNGRRGDAAKLLGLSHSTMNHRRAALGLDKSPEKRSNEDSSVEKDINVDGSRRSPPLH